MKMCRLLWILMLCALFGGQVAYADTVAELGQDVWSWRAETQPNTGDDIPRIIRPKGWVSDWSPSSISARYETLSGFEARWRDLADTERAGEAETDYRLVGSALARVRWELDHVAAWKRQPHFYITQALTPIFEALLPPPPVDAERYEDVRRLVRNIPNILEGAALNLTDQRGPFVEVAMTQLTHVEPSLYGMAEGLDAYLTEAQKEALDADIENAIAAFKAYREFLTQDTQALNQETSVGRKSYEFFLNEVALYPYLPEDLVLMGEQEWARSAAFEAFEQNRNEGLDPLPLEATVQDVISRLKNNEHEVRVFLEEKGILSVPEGVGHYYGQPFPDYLKPLAWLGRTFDLTNADRLDENATVYLPDPSPDLGFFNKSIARDPRPIIVHEGVPGHYFQLALSWGHPNPLRRQYYDSGANEGTGFYAEEMMLQAGFFDDSPKTREVIYSFARLRALRVDVDVKLALGEYTIAQAADYLEQKLSLDRTTAEEEAIFFAATPGQAISYQIGKLQTIDFLSAARMKQGEDFDLKAFHDYLWLNGNVPISLLKKEYLQD